MCNICVKGLSGACRQRDSAEAAAQSPRRRARGAPVRGFTMAGYRCVPGAACGVETDASSVLYEIRYV